MGAGDGVGQRHFFHHRVEQRGVEVARQPRPGAFAPRTRGHDGVDPGQRDAAQDEGQHRGRQVVALRQPAGGHHAAIARLRQRIGQGVRAHGIHHRGPALFLERLARRGEFGAVDHGGGAQSVQVVCLVRLAGGCDHAVTQAGQQRHGHAAHAAGGAGDEHFAVTRLHAVVFQREHAQHGGVAGGADGHGGSRAQALGHAHQPVALEPRLLGQTAPMGFAHAPAVVDEGVAGLPVRVGGFDHLPCPVDAGHHGPLAHHRRAVGDGQRVLVVQRGPGHAHQHVAGGQLGLIERAQAGAEAGLVFFEQQGLEHGVQSG